MPASGCMRPSETQPATATPCCTSHITVVSVATETSVPSSTEPEAGSTQASYCRASTKTLSAGGSAAISTAVVDPVGSNGPSKVSRISANSRMHHELDQHQERHLPRHSRERPQRHRDAEREQRAGRRGVLQKLQQPVERDRRLEMKRRRCDAERGRDHERMQHDLARHFEDDARRSFVRRAAPAPSAAAPARRTAASRSRRSARPAPPPAAPTRRERKPRPHVADIAVGARPAPRSRLRPVLRRTAKADAERQRQHQERAERRRQDEAARC